MNKKFKSIIVSVIFIGIVFITSTEIKPVYAGATVQYSDDAGNTGIGSCGSPTTLESISTSFPAGNNLIIASVQATSTDNGNEDVTVTIDRSGTLATNQYPIQVGTSGTQNNYMLLYKDIGAPANPTYSVTGCRSATAVSAETKLIALSGFEQNGFVDGSSTAITSGADRTVATVSPTMSAGDNIIIASIQIDNGVTAQTISAGNIKLKNTAGTTLTSNEFSMQFGTAAPTDIQAITLIYVETDAVQNPTYTVTINPAQDADAEAKILVFQSTKIKYVDGTSTAVGSSATVLATTTSTFSGENIVEISASEFDDTGSTIETYTATTGNEIREGTTAVAGNQYALRAFIAGGNSEGDGHRHFIVNNIASSGTNQSYEVRAIESANNAQNGASQLVVFKVASPLTPLLPSDTPTLSDSATLKQKIFPSDTPTLSDSATIYVIHSVSATDTPTLSDSATLKQKIFPSDTPTLSDSATIYVIHSVSATDTPTLSEAVLMAKILATSDTPILSESVTLKQKLFPGDTPTLSESVTLLGIQSLSADDTLDLSESVAIKQSLFPTDIPAFSDSADAQKKSTTSGGGGGDRTAPSIDSATLTSLGDPKSGTGVIIGEGDELNNLSQYRHIKVDEKINLRFEVNEDQGINSIAHASLYIGKGKSSSEVSESDTYIRFEKNKPFEISDPHKLFTDVSFALLKKDTINFVFRFDITFAKPIDKSSILFRTWDLNRNADEVWYVNTLEVENETPTTFPGILEVPESPNYKTNDGSTNSTGVISADERLEVEKWAGYHSESISDSELLKILGINSLQSVDDVGKNDNETVIKIPTWFKNNVTKWMLEGKVSFTEFVEAIKYMSDKKIL